MRGRSLQLTIIGLVIVSTTRCVVMDLSHSLDSDSIRFPINPEFIFTIVTRGIQPEGYWLELNKFETPEHIGTHLDAPSHFAKGNWRVYEIPTERLVGPGVVIDIRRQVAKDPDYRLNVADILRWERLYGPIPDGAIVFMWSGWDVRYPNKSLTFNTNTPEDLSTWHFPGFHPAAATWLVQKRNVSMIGVDTPSTDFAQSADFQVHHVIHKANKMGLENVNNLGLVPPSGSFIVALPVKLFNGSGSPVRIIAMFDDKKQPSCRRKYC